MANFTLPAVGVMRMPLPILPLPLERKFSTRQFATVRLPPWLKTTPSYGDDANPCTFGSPCKTFQQAVNVVAAGGEVTAISAGFPPIQKTTTSGPARNAWRA